MLCRVSTFEPAIIVRIVLSNRPAMSSRRRRQRLTMRDVDPYARRRAEDVHLFVRPRCWGGLSGNVHRPLGHRLDSVSLRTIAPRVMLRAMICINDGDAFSPSEYYAGWQAASFC